MHTEPTTKSEDREAFRLRMIERYQAQVVQYQAEANRAHKEGDWEGVALCRHVIGEANRFLESLRADKPHLRTMTTEPEPTVTVRKFRWWYRGVTPNGTAIAFQGSGWAKDSSTALNNIEKMMRAKWPKIRWKQGRDTEGEGNHRGVRFGPTVQMLKTTKPT